MAWDVWWVWVAGGILLGILEVFAPGFIFPGICGRGRCGGSGVADRRSAGRRTGRVGADNASGFAVSSLVAWLVLRRLEGVRKGQKKLWDTDINEQ